MNPIRTTGLLDSALRAHGGIERWRQAKAIHAHLIMTGPVWTAVGLPRIFDGVGVTVSVPEQRTVFTDFGEPGRRGIYTPDLVTVEDEYGAVRRERRAPRGSFPVRDADTRWDELHALYFGGYALWNYLLTPYLLTLPGVRSEELGSRQLRVSFPPNIATHSRQQTFYFDESGRQRRVDYRPEVLGSQPAAHLTEDHQTVSGLVFPTRRTVFRNPEGRVDPTPIITLTLSQITVD